ncbi:hypothetical protein AB0H73_05995 [Streptomyces olivoreticuli]
MMYRKRVTERYNMGNYEFIEVSVETEYDPERHDVTDVEETIDYLLVKERLLARQHTAEAASFIHVHPGLNKPHRQRS